MTARGVMWGALLVWAALYLWSFVAFATTAPTDIGLTRGLNRITAFLGWQAAAALPALIAGLAGHRGSAGWLERWISRCPLIATAALVLGIAGLIGWANLSRPAPQPANPAPVTSPD